ncbi:MAG: VWA domain-containing protein [Sphingobacteriales bacterium]|jgi:Ca-activated chloride channel family protein|nr:VWA domain-containing protein [Sphingobacteriales bacterium]
MNTFSKFVFVLILLAFGCQNMHAQTTRPIKTRILFLLDASGSMYARMDNDTRINVARRLLGKTIDSLVGTPNLEIALRVYGHTSPPNQRNCKDTRLEVPFRKGNFEEVKNRIQAITPKGTTLIAHSLLQSAYDFPKEPYTRNVIILITDGIEECQGDPCAVSEALQSQGVILKPFIIGLGSTEDFKKAFECVGRYYDANTEQGFDDALKIVVSQALNNTTAQVNLLDVFSKPTETNVNMSFYDMNSGQLLYNYMHTINERGNPDTINLDPVYRYRMVVHTIPPVVKENIDVSPGKHTIIGVDAPQGQLMVKVDGLTNYNGLQFLVRQKGSDKTLHVQDGNTKEKYLVGKYDVEVLSIPRMVREISIDQSYTTTLQLPQPGKLVVNAPAQDYYADVYQTIRNELVWVYKFPVEKRNNVLVMQPGDYKLIYRAKGASKSSFTFERVFKITSGQATNITLN